MAVPAYKQIPGTNFLVDAFRRPQQDKIYFLTHAHSDHYAGITETWSAGPIYCSETTADLVQLLTGVSAQYLRPLRMENTTSISGVHVTLIDANHCPGAAQVLFELPDGRRYIHCGDMRYSPSMQLNPHLLRFRNADAMFLDTTYAHPRHTFPPQEDAVEFVASRIQQLLQEDAVAGAGQSAGNHAAGADAGAATVHQHQQHQPEQAGPPDVPHPGPAVAQDGAEQAHLERQDYVSQPPLPLLPPPEQHQQQEEREDACLEGVQEMFTPEKQQQQQAGCEGDIEEEQQRQQQQLGFRRLYLISTYVIGKERLLLAVAARTRRKLLVTHRKLKLLRAADLTEQQLEASFTTDPFETPIRVVCWGHLGDTWPFFRPNFTNMEADRVAAGAQEVVGFVPTGWMYEMKKAAAAGGPCPFPVRTKASCSVWLVPYSEHSSFTELREYVGFIRPKQVIPTVGVGEEGPEADKKVSDMLKHFRGLLDETANKRAFIARLGLQPAAARSATPPAPPAAAAALAGAPDAAPPAAVDTQAAAGTAAAAAVVDACDPGFWDLPPEDAAAPMQLDAGLIPEALATPGVGDDDAPSATTAAAPHDDQQPPNGTSIKSAAFANASAPQASSPQNAAAPPIKAQAAGASAGEPASNAAEVLLAIAAPGELSLAQAEQLLSQSGGDLNAAMNVLLDRQVVKQPQQLQQPQPAVRTTAASSIKRPSSSSSGSKVQGSKKQRKQQKLPGPSATSAGQSAITAFFSRNPSQQQQQQKEKPKQQQEPAQAAHQQPEAGGQLPGKQLDSPEAARAPVGVAGPGQRPRVVLPPLRTTPVQQRHPSPAQQQQQQRTQSASQQHPGPPSHVGPDAPAKRPKIVLPPLLKRPLQLQDQAAAAGAFAASCAAAAAAAAAADKLAAAAAAGAASDRPFGSSSVSYIVLQQPRADGLNQGPAVQAGTTNNGLHAQQQQQQVQQQLQQQQQQQDAAAAVSSWHALLPGSGAPAKRRKTSNSSSIPAGTINAVQRLSAGQTPPPQVPAHATQVPAHAETVAAAAAAAGGAAAAGAAPASSTRSTIPTAAHSGTASLSITSSADVVPAALRQAPLLPLQRYHPVKDAVWSPGSRAPYLALALTLSAIDSTSSRTQIATGLTNLFRSLMLLSPQDVVPAAYLLCGRIGPEYASLELNIGGSSVSSALCDVCGISRNMLRDMYKQYGDLGDVAQACRRKQTLLQAPQPLTISGLFSALHSLAAMSGQGATARRQAVVAKLLRAARDVETRYLVRTLIQNLRVGAGYRSVLPPLAKAALLHRRMLAEAASKAADASASTAYQAPEDGAAAAAAAAAYASSSASRVNKVQLAAASAAVSAAYHRCPNIQVIVDVLMESGPETLDDRVQLVCGVPVKPMLARPCTGAADALRLLSTTSNSAAAAAHSSRGTAAGGGSAAAVPRADGAGGPAAGADAVVSEAAEPSELQLPANEENVDGRDSGSGSDSDSGSKTESESGAEMGGDDPAVAAAASTAAAGPPGPTTDGHNDTPALPAAAAATTLPSGNSSSRGLCVLAEYKYDGQRAQIHVGGDRQVRIFSRNCDEHTAAFPDVVAAILEAVDPHKLPIVLDAELAAVDRAHSNRLRAFQELATRRRGSAAAAAVAAPDAPFPADTAAGAAAAAGKRGSTKQASKAAAAAAATDGGVVKSRRSSREEQQRDMQQRLLGAPDISLHSASTAHDSTSMASGPVAKQLRLHEEGEDASAASTTAQKQKKQQQSDDQVDVCVFVFDALCIAGKDVMNCSLRERRAAAAAALSHLTPGVVQFAEGIEVKVGGTTSATAAPTVTHADPPAAAAPAVAVEGCGSDVAPEGATAAAPAGQAASGGGSSWGAAEQQLTDFFFAALDAGTEGLMFKLMDGPGSSYTPAQRGLSWLKLKRDYMEGLADSLDLVPIGAWHGQGRKVQWFSPFLLAVYDPKTESFQSLCRVMSGFTDEFYAAATARLSATAIPARKPYYDTREVPNVWFEPTEVWEVRGADLSISPVHRAAAGRIHPDRGIGLRFPRFLRLRPDKGPEEASGPDLVTQLYNKQTRRIWNQDDNE